MLTGAASSQPLFVQWQHCYGGSEKELNYSLIGTADGGFAMAGRSVSSDGDITNPHGLADIWVVKTDSSGNIQWEKSLGGTNNELIGKIIQTLDGGYAVIGSTSSNDGDVSGHHGGIDPQFMYDGWVIKLDDLGNIQWQKALGGTRNEIVFDITQLYDSSYVLAARAESDDGDVTGHIGTATLGNTDYWIVKLNPAGNIIWDKSYGGSGGDYPTSLVQADDGGFVIAGSTGSNNFNVSTHIGLWGFSDFWIIKTDSMGTLEWEKSLGGTDHDNANSIIKSNDGGYVISGSTRSNDTNVTVLYGQSDTWVVKIDSSANLVWEKSLGGSGLDYSNDLVKAPGGGYMIINTTFSEDHDVTFNYGATDIWLSKLSETGTLEYQANYGGTSSDAGVAIIQMADSNYAMVGSTNSNNYDVSGSHGDEDYWLVILGADSTTSINNIEIDAEKIAVFPNPAVDVISFSGTIKSAIQKFSLYDLTGRLIFEKNVNNNSNVDISSLSPALYFYVIESAKQKKVYGKFLKN